jgi:hypothetical protein
MDITANTNNNNIPEGARVLYLGKPATVMVAALHDCVYINMDSNSHDNDEMFAVHVSEVTLMEEGA